MATPKTLIETIQEKLADHLFVLVSNREPYYHTLREGKIECVKTVGGVVRGIEPIIKTASGIWVAHGSGNADRKVTDKKGKIKLPPDSPQYTLRRIWLSKEDEEGYYYGYSNEAIWPLCHNAYTRPVFRTSDWERYFTVNRRFAEAVLDEIGPRRAFVWIQDFHLSLVARFLKESRPDLITAHFWHIPWPYYEIFRICPQRQMILDGILANNLIGFHTAHDVLNFFYAADREIECRTDSEHTMVVYHREKTTVKSYPISVDFDAISRDSESPRAKELTQRFREEFNLEGYEFIAAGLDRIDYTKGIPERLQAVDRFLEKYPEYRRRFVFIQSGAISRLHLPRYKYLNDEINALVEQINWKHSTDSWIPIIFVRRDLDYFQTLGFFRLAHVLLVSSLQDGMNLISKEFVAARVDLDAALVLSRFTGASRELSDAIQINPFDTEDFADGINTALTLSTRERRKRMRRMREYLSEHNIYQWANEFITDLTRL